MTATPADGWVLAGWSGDCSGAAGCEVVMDTKRSVTARFAPKPSGDPPPPPPPPPPPAREPGPAQRASFDDLPAGPAKGALTGVNFPEAARVFVPRFSAPSSYPRAVGLGACQTPGQGSALPMSFDIPLMELEMKVGFDDVPAPAGGTYARLIGYDASGKQVADSGDVPLARPGSDGSVATAISISSLQAQIASATVHVGHGTTSHDTGARCAVIDDLLIRVPIDALLRPSVTITTPQADNAVFAQTSDVRISGTVSSPHGVDAFCLTSGTVAAMPPDCNWIITLPDPRDPSRTITEPLHGDRFANLNPPGLGRGRNRVTVWIRDARGQIASDTVEVEVTGQPLTYAAVIRGVEITQAVQQFALPRLDGGSRATTQVPYAHRSGNYEGVTLAAGGGTVVRVFPQFVYAGTASLRGLSARLWGYSSSGALLAGGPLTPVAGPATLAPSTDFSTGVLDRMRADAAGGFAFVLPANWTRAGNLRIVAELVTPPPTARLREADTVAARFSRAAGVSGIPFQAMQPYRLSVIALDSTFAADSRAPGITGARACGAFTADAFTQMIGWFSGLQAIMPLGMGQLQIGPYAGCIDSTAIHRCNDADRRSGGCNPRFDGDGNRTGIDGELRAATRRFADANRTPGAAFGLAGVSPGVGLAGNGLGVSSTDNRPMSSVAHEVGHMLGRPHAGCPNSGDQAGEAWPPDGVGLIQGVGLDRRGTSGSAFRVLMPNQTVTGATCSPAEGARCTGSSRPQMTDLMSYCGDSEETAWISTRNWTTLINGMRVGASDPPRGVGGSRMRLSAASSSRLVVDALVTPGSATVVHVGASREAPTPPAANATYAVVLRDAQGQVLRSTGVAVEPPSEPGSPSLLSAVLPATPNATRVEILRNGEVVAARDRSANAPRVALLSPRAGARLAGRFVTVRWRATDADGNRLSATVEYSRDGGRTYRALGLGGGDAMRLPARLFARSRNGRVRVAVNDGFSESSVTSGRISSRGGGPLVAIQSGARARRIANDASLTLAGLAFDDTGARLTGKRLRWYAGRRYLGSGATLNAQGLPAGTRAVRLVARDGAGRTGTASVPVRVFASAPQFTVLRAPAKVSRRARTARLRVASAIPARLTVNGRRHSVSRRTRAVTVRVPRSAAPVVLRLRLTAAGRTSTRTLRIPRG